MSAARKTKRERKAAARKQRERFVKARNAEHEYARHLRKIARAVGDVVKGFASRGWVHERLADLVETLERYAEVLEPWARAVSARMLADVSRRDERAWFDLAEEMGRSIRSEMRSAPTGALTRELLDSQVHLIKSLPREAAERVQKLAARAVHTGARADAIAREIMRTGEVTRGRADLIARTETSRAQALFTQARAQHLGSTHYVWRTARDADVRESHRKLEGTTHAWDSPPIAGESGERANPGCIYNCRCHAAPVFGD